MVWPGTLGLDTTIGPPVPAGAAGADGFANAALPNRAVLPLSSATVFATRPPF